MGRGLLQKGRAGSERGSRVRPATVTAWAAVIAVALLPKVAGATSTRIYTLGAMNRFIVDDSNKWLYPQMITKFGNLFYVELFGTGQSRASAAPGSVRNSSLPAPRGMLNLPNADYQIYDLADSVPVQQTAGGGAIIKLTDDLFVGLHLSDYQNPTIPALLTLLSGSSMGSPTQPAGWVLSAPPEAPSSTNRKFDLFLAYNLQDLARFGLLLSYGSSKYSRNPYSNNEMIPTDTMGHTESRRVDDIGTSELGILLGASFDLGEAATIDSGFGIKFHGLTYLPNQRQLIDGGGGLELDANVRAMIGVSEMWEVIPALTVRYLSVTAADLGSFATGFQYIGDDRIQITDVALKRLVVDFGLAGHLRPTDFIDFWAAFGVEFGRWSASFDNKIEDDPEHGIGPRGQIDFSRDTLSFDAIPYGKLGLEARIFSWLDFRGSVIKYLRSNTVKEDKLDKHNSMNNALNDVSKSAAFFDYFVGFAAHYEGFFLDFQIDPLWFQRGPNFLSGASGNMFVNASLGYRF